MQRGAYPADLWGYRQSLTPEPGWNYGDVLPYRTRRVDDYDRLGTEKQTELAVPGLLAEAGRGYLDMLASGHTGDTSPEMMGNLLGGALAPGGAAGDALAASGVMRPQVTRAPFDASSGPPMGHNMPPVAEPRAPVTPDGFAVQGKAYTKASQQTMKEIAEGPKGAGPLELGGDMRSTAPQADIQRYQPPRGISPRLQRALENQELRAGVIESIRRGQSEFGADKWYHTEPIRQAFVAELGPDEGARAFSEYMGYTAGTSPRSDVSTNMRNASYYYLQGGQDLPAQLPYPYGHVAQNLHRQNYDTLRGEGWDVIKNPKPPSFQANLEGNLKPVTVDTHAFRNIAMRTADPEFLETSISVPMKPKKPKKGEEGGVDEEEAQLLTLASRYGEIQDSPKGPKVVFRPQKLVAEGRLTMEDALQIPAFWASKPRNNEYGAAEAFYKSIADELGMEPADVQAAAWAGAGNMTGLKSPPTKTFNEIFNERVLYTARMRGEDPKDTLRMFIRREKPLLQAPAAGAPMGGLLGDQPQMDDEELRSLLGNRS
jgi:hypothetical protein